MLACICILRIVHSAIWTIAAGIAVCLIEFWAVVSSLAWMTCACFPYRPIAATNSLCICINTRFCLLRSWWNFRIKRFTTSWEKKCHQKGTGEKNYFWMQLCLHTFKNRHVSYENHVTLQIIYCYIDSFAYWESLFVSTGYLWNTHEHTHTWNAMNHIYLYKANEQTSYRWHWPEIFIARSAAHVNVLTNTHISYRLCEVWMYFILFLYML